MRICIVGAGAMQAAGFEVGTSGRIRDEVWIKLIGNLSYNPVAALTLARMEDIHANPPLLERIAIARRIGNAKVSMRQDIERGRPLEIEAIVGSVMELAARAGVATPMIGAVHALLAERARHAGPAGG